MFDEDTQATIRRKKRGLRTRSLREEFESEAMRELWDFMPFERSEITAIIERVFRRFEGE
jgi:hypothetical protein